MSTIISIRLSPSERDALLARARSKGITIEDEAKQLIHNAVVEEIETLSAPDENGDPFGIKGLGFGSAMAKIWEGFELPEEYEIKELRFTGFDRDPFADE
jgi:hypothetical protein